MAKKRKTYLDGLLDAMIAIAEVTGPIKLSDMQPQTWQVLTEFNIRLTKMAADEADQR